jgi:hypothetical protein
VYTGSIKYNALLYILFMGNARETVEEREMDTVCSVVRVSTSEVGGDGGGEETTECVARRLRGHIPVNIIGFCWTDGEPVKILLLLSLLLHKT